MQRTNSFVYVMISSGNDPESVLLMNEFNTVLYSVTTVPCKFSFFLIFLSFLLPKTQTVNKIKCTLRLLYTTLSELVCVCALSSRHEKKGFK